MPSTGRGARNNVQRNLNNQKDVRRRTGNAQNKERGKNEDLKQKKALKEMQKAAKDFQNVVNKFDEKTERMRKEVELHDNVVNSFVKLVEHHKKKLEPLIKASGDYDAYQLTNSKKIMAAHAKFAGLVKQKQVFPALDLLIGLLSAIVMSKIAVTRK